MSPKATPEEDRTKGIACSIRPATPTDLDAVLEIEQASFGAPWPESAFIKEMDTKGWSRFEVTVCDNEITGFMIYWIVASDLHLLNLAVHPNWRRNGVGRIMVEHVIHQANMQNRSRVRLEVRMSNRAAQRLYSSCGFESHAIRPGYYSNNGEDALIMLHRNENNSTLNPPRSQK